MRRSPFPDRQIVQSLIAQLGWTHFQHIIYFDDELKRDFYAKKGWQRRVRDGLPSM